MCRWIYKELSLSCISVSSSKCVRRSFLFSASFWPFLWTVIIQFLFNRMASFFTPLNVDNHFFLLVAVSQIVGANNCTWGPSFWCADRKNAEACGPGVNHELDQSKSTDFPVLNVVVVFNLRPLNSAKVKDGRSTRKGASRNVQNYYQYSII